jgi:L-lactate dehydrogenase complex protein LldE
VRIALMATCLVDGLFPDVGWATVRLLRRLGHQVEVPAGQTCCGQVQINTGYGRAAIGVIRNHVDTFARADLVVAPSASCVGSVRHQHAAMARSAGDAPLAVAAGELAARTFELSELLVDVLGVVDVGAYYPHTVAWHPTCHSLRVLGVGDRPRRLLEAVDGLELRNLPDADRCCGFGGTFALKNGPVSSQMLAAKTASIERAGVEVLAAGDASCLMQIGGGLGRAGSPVRVAHLAEILASTR